jgi:hypothetical protein
MRRCGLVLEDFFGIRRCGCSVVGIFLGSRIGSDRGSLLQSGIGFSGEEFFCDEKI